MLKEERKPYGIRPPITHSRFIGSKAAMNIEQKAA